jgi:hypothetical protein
MSITPINKRFQRDEILGLLVGKIKIIGLRRTMSYQTINSLDKDALHCIIILSNFLSYTGSIIIKEQEEG